MAAAALRRGEAAERAAVLAAFKTFGRKLKTAIDLAVARDRKLHDLRTEEAALRRKRDDSKRRLGRQIVGLRRMVRGAYVAPDLTALGLDAPNPKEPTAFLRKAELILDRLGDEDRSRWLGEMLFRTAEDPRVHRDELKPGFRALRRNLEELAKLRRRIDSMLAKKHEAVAEYDRVFLRTARMFEDLCRLAGYEGLADRVRPSTRNPGRTEHASEVADGIVADVLGGNADRHRVVAGPAAGASDVVEDASTPLSLRPADLRHSEREDHPQESEPPVGANPPARPSDTLYRDVGPVLLES